MTSFQTKIEKYFSDFFSLVSNDNGEWTVKGFIDIYKNIYTISLDTKVVSKIIELMIFPVIMKFANENNYQLILSSHQNHYPDITFIDKSTGEKIALDLKSTYRVNDDKVNGMTLGAFTGYFRNRKSNKNITFPYSEYSEHFVLGIIYSKTDLFRAKKLLLNYKIKPSVTQLKYLTTYLSEQSEEKMKEFLTSLRLDDDTSNKLKKELEKCVIDERQKHTLSQLQEVNSVIRDFDFFVQEKWKIAIDRPGSGNTKNIGSTTKINELKKGKAVFTKHKNSKELFNDYWSFYLTKDMARASDLENPPYKNLKTYCDYKNIKHEE